MAAVKKVEGWKMGTKFSVCRAALIGFAIAACYPAWAQEAPAGRVDFATGNVTAVSATGEKRVLAKGAEIKSGETVDTGAGRAQVRFSDGARVSLQPNTQFRIEEYRFTGKPDGTERGVFELISGGMRTITGLIGRANRDSYQVRTKVATIGIRGTEYNIQYINSIAGGVGQGRIAVCNNAGCGEFAANESFIVTDINTLPQQTFKKMELEDRGPQRQNLGGYVAGEVSLAGVSGLIDLGSGGGIAIGGGAGGGGAAGGGGGGGIGGGGFGTLVGNINGAIAFAHSTPDVPDALPTGYGYTGGPLGQFQMDGSGRLNQFSDNGTTTHGGLTRSSDGNDGIIAWGTWIRGGSGKTGGSGDHGNQPYEALHYVAGVPTSAADMGALQIAATTASYTFLGGTMPTSGATVGVLNSASLTANFGAGTATAGVSTTFSGSTYSVSGIPLAIGGAIPAQFSGTGGTGSGSCGGGCTATVEGFFAGPNAIRAGFAYQIDGALPERIVGAAAFKR